MFVVKHLLKQLHDDDDAVAYLSVVRGKFVYVFRASQNEHFLHYADKVLVYLTLEQYSFLSFLKLLVAYCLHYASRPALNSVVLASAVLIHFL